MAVNLSPYGGVGAQFLDNSGNVLTGGKIFTYAAGTTTNQATYTTSAGNIPHSNPIILDASGRVPSGGEIWLTDGLSYKFILRDANDVLIATYDNVTGINSNFVNFTNEQEIQTATAGQTVFNLVSTTYQPGTNSLSVFVDGVNQYGPGAQYAYIETNSTTVTFVNGLHVGALVKFTTSQLNSSGASVNAAQVSYDPPFTGAVATNVEVALSRTISVDDFGADPTGIADSYAAIQAALDYAIPLSLHVEGTGKYLITQQINIPQYRTTPPVTLDFIVLNFTLNQLTYTGATGTAIQVESPAVSVYIKKLIGPGAPATCSGLTIVGQGDPQHRVDYVTGFSININLFNAYSHTVWVGYCQDADIGVLMTASNHIKLYAGRIGGQFTPGNIAIDPSTCGVGVRIDGGVANEVHATIEYCKRTVNSIGLLDNGQSTYYRGYLEGSNLWNIYASGAGGQYYSVTGGNIGPSGVYLENDNQFLLTQQKTEEQVAPTGSNTTLTFETPSKFETEGFAKINGVQGYTEQQISTVTSVTNQIIDSATLNAASWTLSTIGSANWGAVTINTAQPGFAKAGYGNSTRFIFPGLPGASDIYYATQNNRVTTVGPLNYGLWVWVESGDIDIQIRLVELANNLQSKQVVRLGASNKWVNVAARYIKNSTNASDVNYEIQFRTTTGATIRIANTYLVNDADTFFAPWNRNNTIKANIPGIPVNGNCFEQGIRINGAIQNQISPAISSAGQFVLSQGDFPVYVVTGGWTGNLLLENSAYDGQRIVIKRDGVAATGSMQLIPSSTIDGTNTPINIAPAYTTLEVIWSSVASGWLRLN
jgi:hypothetical protein